MSRRQKELAFLWGVLWLGLGSFTGLAFLGAAVLGSAEWRVSLGLMVPLLAGMAGGGLVAFFALRSMGKSPAVPLRLPPAWALGGGFVVAMAAGLGLWQAEISRAFLMPVFAALAAALAPLAAASSLSRVLGSKPAGVTARRGWVALGLGTTASVSLAYALNALLPLGFVCLVSGLAGEVLPRAEGLLDALSFGVLKEELLSPWFLFSLVEMAVIAPLVEELVKPLPLLPLLKRLESPHDALLLGALAGAGFAAVENLLYAAISGPAWGWVLAFRALGAALHPFGAGLMAAAWWAVLRGEPKAASCWARNYGLAVGAHALWNGTSVVAAAVANAWFQGWEVNLLGVTDGAVLLALLAAEGIGLLLALRALPLLAAEYRFRGGVPVHWASWGGVDRPGAHGTEESEVSPPPPGMPTARAMAVWGLICLAVLVPVGLGVLQTM